MEDSDSIENLSGFSSETKLKNNVDWRKIRSEKKRQLKELKERRLLKKLEKLEKNKNDVSMPQEKDETDVTPKKKAKREVPTVSLAVPGSILDNAQSPELRTLLAGQIARAASISCVDEVIIYDETGTTSISEEDEDPLNSGVQNSNVQMARILQYLECPQYLRKYFFPLHKDLKFAGLLPPLDSPHHLRESDWSNFREGVILDRPVKDGQGSFVNVGLQKTIQLDKKLDTGLRVTVRLQDSENNNKKRMRCQAVDPTTPRTEEGTYWGYNVRMAQSLGSIFAQCPYSGGYDLTVGTSDKGDSVDELSDLPLFRHLLIVFGGVKGLEYALDCDESLTVEDPRHLFHQYINTFPGQGSRTIRTEEAVLLTMAILRPTIQKNIALSTTMK